MLMFQNVSSSIAGILCFEIMLQFSPFSSHANIAVTKLIFIDWGHVGMLDEHTECLRESQMSEKVHFAVSKTYMELYTLYYRVLYIGIGMYFPQYIRKFSSCFHFCQFRFYITMHVKAKLHKK